MLIIEKNNRIFMKDTNSNIFKEKAHLLDEMPSSNSWNNVKSNLDKRHKKSNLIKVLNIALGIAASTLIAVNVFWVMEGFGPQMNSKNVAQLSEFTPSPWSVYRETPQHQVKLVSNDYRITIVLNIEKIILHLGIIWMNPQEKLLI